MQRLNAVNVSTIANKYSASKLCPMGKMDFLCLTGVTTNVESEEVNDL